MARVKKGVTAHRRHRRLLKLTRGYWGSRGKLLRPARETLMKGLWYSLRDRRARKRDFRRLWIARINAAARSNGMSYSRLISGLRRAGVEIDRKMLADLAVHDGDAFRNLVAEAKRGLGA
jgi:large subunit ribosomal protein L20